MLGGALAASIWGEPRSTQDVDFVINLQPEQIPRLSEALARRNILLPADLMLDQLLETRGDVALVCYHTSAGFKAELFPLRPNDELRASALARRVRVERQPPLGGVYLHSPEDLILYKLIYYDISAQTKHLRDIASILAARGPELDRAYLKQWVERLNLQPVWKHMLDEARARGTHFPAWEE